MSLILIGMPKSGKSTVGKILSEKLGWKLIDTDKLIENSYHEKNGQLLSCREIFRIDGESKFRFLEKEQILSINSNNFDNFSIISAGGGSLLDIENRDHLKKLGIFVFIKVSQDIIWKRITKRGLPNYLKAENSYDSFVQIAQTRIPLYEASADITINSDRLSSVQVALLVIQRLKSFHTEDTSRAGPLVSQWTAPEESCTKVIKLR